MEIVIIIAFAPVPFIEWRHRIIRVVGKSMRNSFLDRDRGDLLETGLRRHAVLVQFCFW